MKKRPLTDRQRRFADAYLTNPNAAEAARRSGSSATNFRQAGYEMLSNAKVRQYIDAATAQKKQKDADLAYWVKAELMKRCSADLGDLFDGNELRPIGEWPPVWRNGLIKKLRLSNRKAGSASIRSFAITRVDPLEDLVTLGEMIGVFERQRRRRS